MASHICFFRHSVFVLFKNPVLFLLPLVGATLSIIVEILFTRELYHSSNGKIFFPESLLFGLFFAAFMITYFQLGMSRKSINLDALYKNNNLNIEVLELFIIYSIYASLLVIIGGYEGQIREAYSIKLDSLSLYTFKITTFHDIIAIIPAGIVIVLSSTLASFIFSAWMVQYVIVIDKELRHGLIDSFRRLAYAGALKDTRKKMLLLFLVTLVMSILDFVLTNVAVIHTSDTLQSYISQFVILSVIDLLYAPFFIICLFLIVLSGSFPSTT
jgi:hypothetical protein